MNYQSFYFEIHLNATPAAVSGVCSMRGLRGRHLCPFSVLIRQLPGTETSSSVSLVIR